MKNSFLIIVLFFLSCGESSLQPTNNHIQNGHGSSECRLPGAEIVAYDSFKVELHINEISFDSIIANVDFFNGTSDTLPLLKKILPSDSLKEGIFTLFKNVRGNYGERIEPLPVESKNIYAMGMQFIHPMVVPNLAVDSFEVMRPGDTRRYSVNLAKIYDFRHINQAALFINCNIYFPLIKNRKQVMIPSPHDSKFIVPVYFRVGNLPDTTENIGEHNLYRINLPIEKSITKLTL